MDTVLSTNAKNFQQHLADNGDYYDHDILQTPREMEDYDEDIPDAPREMEDYDEDFCELSETQQKCDLMQVQLIKNSVSTSACVPDECEYPDKHDDVDLSDFTMAESETIIRISLKYGMLYSDVIYYSHNCTHCVNNFCVWSNECDGLNQ
jgi:hypothetical protein